MLQQQHTPPLLLQIAAHAAAADHCRSLPRSFQGLLPLRLLLADAALGVTEGCFPVVGCFLQQHHNSCCSALHWQRTWLLLSSVLCELAAHNRPDAPYP